MGEFSPPKLGRTYLRLQDRRSEPRAIRFDVKKENMFDIKRRGGLTFLVFLLLSVFLAGFNPGAERRLRGYAQEFVTAIDIDIAEEKHKVLIAPIHMDEPTSFIRSEYIVSDTPEEVKEKLRALHLAEKGWLAPSEDGWIGAQVSSLSPQHATPEYMKRMV